MKNQELQKSLHLSLKKISGMVQKITQMIEDDASCVSVVQQMDATIGLLASARKKIISDRLEECLQKSKQKMSQDDVREFLKLYDVIKK